MNERRRMMILDWMRKIHQLEYAHRYESLSWSQIEKWLGLSAFILSTVVAFSFRFPTIDAESYEKLSFLFKRDIFVPLVSGAVALLTGIQTFLRPGEKSETHKKTASNYEKLRHKIEYILTIETSEVDLEEQVKTLKAEWENLDAINVSEKTFQKGKEKVKSLNIYPKDLGFIKHQQEEGQGDKAHGQSQNESLLADTSPDKQ